MKKFLNFLFGGLLVLMSCESNTLLDAPEQTIEAEGIKTRSASCLGGNCLPKVEMYHSATGTDISWYIESIHGCNNYLISCEGAGLFHSEIVGNNGYIYFSHTLTSYKINYVIYCKSCRDCHARGSFVKKENSENGTMGEYFDCQKEFHSYLLSQCYLGASSEVSLSSPSQVSNPEDYLTIDYYKIYEIRGNYHNSYTEIRTDSIGDSIIRYLPSNPMLSYEIRFFSNECDRETHYLYCTYSGRQPPNIGSGNTTLWTAKSH